MSAQFAGKGQQTQRKKRRTFLVLLLAIVILLAGTGTVIWFMLPNIFPPGITTVWHTSSATFTTQDQQTIQSAWKTALQTSHSGNIAGHQFTIINAQHQGNWAIFSGNEQEDASAPPIASEPLFFIAHRDGSTWDVWIPSSSGFCTQLKQLPDTLLSEEDKHYFLGCYR